MRIVMLPWVLAACSEFGLDPIDDPNPPPELVVVEESFVQRALPALDVLFVVDASTSMTQELAALANGVDGLVEGLNEADVGWQLGVVTAAGSLDGSGDSPLLRGQPWILTAELPDVSGAFADAIPQPSVLAGEAGIAAAIAALDEANGGANQGFRRHGAAFVVVFVSDGDDASDPLLDDAGGTPAQWLATTLAEQEARYGASARASALVGDLPDGCSSAFGAAQPAPRYHEVVESSGGVVASVCSVDFAPLLEGVAVEAVDYPTRFPLSLQPATDDVQVELDGAPADGWTVVDDLGGAVLVFDIAPEANVRIDVRYPVSNTATGSTSSSSPQLSATSTSEGPS